MKEGRISINAMEHTLLLVLVHLFSYFACIDEKLAFIPQRTWNIFEPSLRIFLKNDTILLLEVAIDTNIKLSQEVSGILLLSKVQYLKFRKKVVL